jgi:hypothetical protein
LDFQFRDARAKSTESHSGMGVLVDVDPNDDPARSGIAHLAHITGRSEGGPGRIQRVDRTVTGWKVSGSHEAPLARLPDVVWWAHRTTR